LEASGCYGMRLDNQSLRDFLVLARRIQNTNVMLLRIVRMGQEYVKGRIVNGLRSRIGQQRFEGLSAHSDVDSEDPFSVKI
jgi:hypothetical protein